MRRISATSSAIALATLVFATPVAAECDGPFPSIRSALDTASHVVMGHVTTLPDLDPDRTDGRSPRFLLVGRSVLDGDARIEMVVEDLMAQPCAGPIEARSGDEIVLAVGTDFTPPVPVTAVAWLSGEPPDRDGVESITLEEVYQRLGRPAPAPTQVDDGAPWDRLLGAGALLLLVGVIVTLVVRKIGRREPT